MYKWALHIVKTYITTKTRDNLDIDDEDELEEG